MEQTRIKQENEFIVEEEKRNKVIVTGVFIVGLVVFSLAGISAYLYFSQIRGGEWSCISQQCVEFAIGDDWVKDNCNLQNNNQLSCNFAFEGIDYFDVPLSEINISRMTSCRRYECSSFVFLKGGAR